MTTSPSVAIIHHERSPVEREAYYLVSMLARRWIDDGIAVRHLYGTAELVPADVAILHVDLSVVPREYAEFARRYPTVLNAGALDIRKRSFSTLAIGAADSFRGAAIVKTDLNSGGGPERLIRDRTDSAMVRFTRRALARMARSLRIAPPHDHIVDPLKYEIFETGADVPRAYFRDPMLIVERFVPERRNGHYCHRRYYFFGDAEVNQLWLGELPVCALDDDGIVEDAPVPEELRRFRDRFGIEFGKIDYALGESGEIIVFDVNKTPWGTCADPDDEPWLEDLCDRLVQGIDGFVRSMPTPMADTGADGTRVLAGAGRC